MRQSSSHRLVRSTKTDDQLKCSRSSSYGEWHGNVFKQIVTSTPHMVVGNTPQFFEPPDVSERRSPDCNGRGANACRCASRRAEKPNILRWGDEVAGEHQYAGMSPSSKFSCEKVNVMRWQRSSWEVVSRGSFTLDAKPRRATAIAYSSMGPGSANPEPHKTWQQL